MKIQKVTWTGANGVEIPVHGGPGRPLVIQRDLVGLDAPPVTIEAFDALGVPGEVRIGVKTEAREFTLPLLIKGADATAVANNWAYILACFSTTAQGWLRVISDWFDRSLQCSYIGGLEGDHGFDADGDVWMKAAIRLRAHTPYWVDTAPTQVVFSQSSLTPFFPMKIDGTGFKLNANATFGSYYATTIGDAPSYPDWVIEGPFDGFTLSNSLGERYQYGRGFPAGGAIYLSFDPLNPSLSGSIPDSSYTSLLYHVWDGTVHPSKLWSIRPGAQSVMVAVRGATSATRVTMKWRKRWLSWRSVAF